MSFIRYAKDPRKKRWRVCDTEKGSKENSLGFHTEEEATKIYELTKDMSHAEFRAYVNSVCPERTGNIPITSQLDWRTLPTDFDFSKPSKGWDFVNLPKYITYVRKYARFCFQKRFNGGKVTSYSIDPFKCFSARDKWLEEHGLSHLVSKQSEGLVKKQRVVTEEDKAFYLEAENRLLPQITSKSLYPENPVIPANTEIHKAITRLRILEPQILNLSVNQIYADDGPYLLSQKIQTFYYTQRINENDILTWVTDVSRKFLLQRELRESRPETRRNLIEKTRRQNNLLTA